MELWPGISKSSKKVSSRKKTETEKWSNYPIINHGGLSAATLVKVNNTLEWRSVHSTSKGCLSAYDGPSKLFPMTRPKDIKIKDLPLRQKAEQGTRYIRTYHPDIDIPFDLIRDELSFDEKVAEQRSVFDPYKGNTVVAAFCYEGIKKRSIALAFPSGVSSKDLNVSPINVKQNGLLFQPRAQPLWSFHTPISQIVTSTSAVNLTEKRGLYLAVRTYGQISIFDIRSQMPSTFNPSKHPFALSEMMTIRPNELNGQGVGYKCSFSDERKVFKRVFDKPLDSDNGFWRICGDKTAHGGIIASGNMSSANSIDLLKYEDGRHIITSLYPAQIGHLSCVSTTSQVIWVDERFAKQPLLGWKHHRAFDRTLNVQTIAFTSLSFLSSYHNNHVSAIALSKAENEPLQCQMPARAVPPGVPGLVELSEQGNIHCLDLHYSENAQDEVGQERVTSRLNFQWSDEVMELEKESKDLRPDYGNIASSEFSMVNLSEVYEALVGEEYLQLRSQWEEKDAERVYETLEEMPKFWQRSELEEDHLRTLFDIVYSSGGEPLHEARADFLTGSVLDSVRGYRARKRGCIPADDVAKEAAWHMNIQETLSKISPDLFKATPVSVSAEELDPYHVSRDEVLPEADRRELEAREQLALDLTLAADIYSATAFRPTVPTETSPNDRADDSQEAAALLTQATEKLSLTQREPPEILFAYHRPVIKDGKKYYKEHSAASASQEQDAQAADEGQGIKMPLGVRLLLSDWNIGDDPYKYEYVDPYDLDGSGVVSQPSRTQSRTRRFSPIQWNGPAMPTQSQVPPVIFSAKSHVSTQLHVLTQRTAKARTQTHGFSQTETEPEFSQPVMANTQILPGPFGNRQATGKKKHTKKRMGGILTRFCCTIAYF
ncbi:hypothetical protein EW145_g1080 [Phellinidium pouzarii]|uniref:Uncharacterized protein n=1 Tax=Phellinidium pouzarii TaxID=167371 RepID=A0A4S4LGE6_9AGAM|nr:hypothetical protein EW145_g1080 [Phellinidium pouzarii]